MLRVDRLSGPLLIALLLLGGRPAAAQTPAGEVAVSFHVTLAPTWFDPSTAPAQITPFGVLYAIHDALVRPLPGQKMGASLAESWTESPDGLVYEFRARVRQVEVVDPTVIRFHLKEPWPDFMTFYGTTATAAGIVLPRKYVEQVGVDGFRQRPVGAGPYKFVSQRPGIDITFEAFPEYWRPAPYVKRLTMKSVPDSTSRLTMLKSGETDYA